MNTDKISLLKEVAKDSLNSDNAIQPIELNVIASQMGGETPKRFYEARLFEVSNAAILTKGVLLLTDKKLIFAGLDTVDQEIKGVNIPINKINEVYNNVHEDDKSLTDLIVITEDDGYYVFSMNRFGVDNLVKEIEDK